jgi:two-component system, NarL family, nitrate/nitrite response regulator NarL
MNSGIPIRLLVVDDHNLFRRGVVALLAQDARVQVVGESADANEAINAAQRLQPDLILLDNHLPGVRGVDAIGDLLRVAPNARVVMLTVSEDEEDLAAGLKAGADGYLLKTIHTEALCESICKVWDGDTVVSPEMMGKLVGLLRGGPPVPLGPVVTNPLPASDPIHTLSPREQAILRLVSRGDSNKHIARALDIAETTVKIHVQHILRKLGLPNRVHAAVYAAERGFGVVDAR